MNFRKLYLKSNDYQYVLKVKRQRKERQRKIENSGFKDIYSLSIDSSEIEFFFQDKNHFHPEIVKTCTSGEDYLKRKSDFLLSRKQCWIGINAPSTYLSSKEAFVYGINSIFHGYNKYKSKKERVNRVLKLAIEDKKTQGTTLLSLSIFLIDKAIKKDLNKKMLLRAQKTLEKLKSMIGISRIVRGLLILIHNLFNQLQKRVNELKYSFENQKESNLLEFRPKSFLDYNSA